MDKNLQEVSWEFVLNLIYSDEKFHKLYFKAAKHHDKKHSFYNGEATKGYWESDYKKMLAEDKLRAELAKLGYYYEDSFCYA